MLDKRRAEGLGVALEACLQRERRLPSSFSTCWMALTAWPIAVPGARLNEIVTDGNWPWWLITSGATFTTLSTSVDNGTCCPLDDLT